jgi:hypothetical protein
MKRFLLYLLPSFLAAQTFDIVLKNGRVIDPESGLDAVRNVGVRGKQIAAISVRPLRGNVEIDATGLVAHPQVARFPITLGKRGYRVRLNGADHQWGKDPPKEVVG